MEQRRVTTAEYNRLLSELKNTEAQLKQAYQERKTQMENETGYEERKLIGTGSLLYDINHLENKIRDYRRVLESVVVSDEIESEADSIGLGDHVTFSNEEGELRTLRLVSILSDYTTEVSTDSPVGKAVYGKKVGDVCTFKVGKNERTITITGVTKAAEVESERE